MNRPSQFRGRFSDLQKEKKRRKRISQKEFALTNLLIQFGANLVNLLYTQIIIYIYDNHFKHSTFDNVCYWCNTYRNRHFDDSFRYDR